MNYIKHLAVILTLIFYGCTAEEEPKNFDRQPILENLSDTLIVPAYSEVISEINSFDANLNELKTAPSESNLVGLQESWTELAVAWKKAELYNFGPIQDLLYATSIHYFPVDTSGIDEALNVINANTQDLSSFGSNKKGVAAIEYILFMKESQLLDAQQNAQLVKYLELLSSDLNNKLTKIENEWVNSYQADFNKRIGNSANDALTLVANEMIFLSEKIKNLKLGLPLAKTGVTTPNPNRLEAPFSKSSAKLLAANVKSMQNAFNGGNGVGIDDYLNSLQLNKDEKLADKINQKFNKIISLTENLDHDFYYLIENNPSQLDDLYLELINLTILLKNDMMSQLGLLTIYSDNDGD